MGIPIEGASLYKKELLEFNNSQELEALIRKHFDKAFITWLAYKKCEIFYLNKEPGGSGVILHGNRKKIFVGSGEPREHLDLTLCHELIHALIPDKRLSCLNEGAKEYKGYEDKIDELAKEYSQNKVLTGYAKSILRSEVWD